MNKLYTLFFLIITVLFVSCSNSLITSSTDKESKIMYRVEAEICTGLHITNVNVNVRDTNRNIVSNAIIKIDDQIIPYKGFNYFLGISEVWLDGSEHSYYIETPDGSVVQGLINKTTGTLEGLTSNPNSSEISNKYIISPPSGVWPQNSFIECWYTEDNEDVLRTFSPRGDQDLIINFDDISNVSNIYFISKLRNEIKLNQYDYYSTISIDSISDRL